jgi:hypothetical protein
LLRTERQFVDFDPRKRTFKMNVSTEVVILFCIEFIILQNFFDFWCDPDVPHPHWYPKHIPLEPLTIRLDKFCDTFQQRKSKVVRQLWNSISF